MSDELEHGEAHPAAYDALAYLRSIPPQELLIWQGTFSSCALAGNRLAEICNGTLKRIMDGSPVSDRYLLGLMWMIKSGRENGEGANGEEDRGLREGSGNSSRKKCKAKNRVEASKPKARGNVGRRKILDKSKDRSKTSGEGK